jgi:hypothetical protein
MGPLIRFPLDSKKRKASMKKIFSRLLIANCLIFFSCGSESKTEQSSQTPSSTQMEKDGITAAKAWLSLIDEGKYAEIWNEAAEIFKNALSEEKWISTIKNLMSNFGKALSREIISSNFRSSLPNAPEGKYVLIQFKTNFEKKKNAVETITPMQDSDGKWRVSGYFIK